MATKKRKKSKVKSTEGVVEKVNKKMIATKNGKKPIFSFLLDDDEWYRTGFNAPDIADGDTVEFEYEKTEYGLEVDFDTLEVTSEADDVDDDDVDDDDDDEEETTPKKKSKSKSSSKKSSTKAVSSSDNGKRSNAFWDQKDMIIQYLAARNSAIAFAAAAVAGGLIKLPKAEAKRLDVFAEVVSEYTTTFFQNSRDVETIQELSDTATTDDD